MTIVYAVVLAMLAGIMNGSYAFPVKRIQQSWSNELTWFVFSIFTFLIMPWIMNFFIDLHFTHFLSSLPSQVIWIELVSGVLFGLGMVLFTFSLKYIGMGISFLLNIGAGTVIATLLPILVNDIHAFTTLFGLLELLAMIIFVIGIGVAIAAATMRDQAAANAQQHYKGILLGIFSGVLTSGQGFAYAYALPVITVVAHQQGFSMLSAVNISWVLLFNGAFVPYTLFFLIKGLQQHTFVTFQKNAISNILRLILMAILYVICLALFSESTLLVGHFGAVISWPLFMIFIILTSNSWGLIQGEWSSASGTAKLLLAISILLMILAVLVLAYNGYSHV